MGNDVTDRSRSHDVEATNMSWFVRDVYSKDVVSNRDDGCGMLS